MNDLPKIKPPKYRVGDRVKFIDNRTRPIVHLLESPRKIKEVEGTILQVTTRYFRKIKYYHVYIVNLPGTKKYQVVSEDRIRGRVKG